MEAAADARDVRDGGSGSCPVTAELLAVLGDDLMVVNAARVSFGKWKTTFDEADAKLIRYLATHGHWTPFAHPQLQFRLTLPLFVARQWFRHTVGFARNEMSRRYVDESPTWTTPRVWRGRSATAKQGSDGIIEQQANATAVFEHAAEAARSAYAVLLAVGVAPEQARAVLPQATHTQVIETGSLYAYARLCRLRLAPDAQRETRALAEQVAIAAAAAFPVSWPALVGAPEG